MYESRAIIKPTGLPAKPSKAKKQEPVDGILLLMTDYLVMLKSVNNTGNLLTNIAGVAGVGNSSDKSFKSKSIHGLSDHNESNNIGAANKSSGKDGFLSTELENSSSNLSYQFLNFQSGQPSVLPLRGLIIRENPTKSNDRFLLSAAHAEVGLYELSFENSTIATTFAEQTRLAAQHCPDDIFLDNQEKFDKYVSNPKNSVKNHNLKLEEEKSRHEYESMVKKCDELMATIRRCDQRIVESINLKQQTSDQLNMLKNSNGKTNPKEVSIDVNPEEDKILLNYEEAEKIDLSPIIKEASHLCKTELNAPKNHKIFKVLNKAYSVANQKDTSILNLRNDLDKQKTLHHHYNLYGRDITDLNKMERIHEIESKRFDRLRKKDRDEIKRLQLKLELERDDIDDQKRKLQQQREHLERQKSEISDQDKSVVKNQYEEDLRKNAEQQRMLMKLREMQRYIEELESRLDMQQDSSTNSPKSYASASPSNSFNNNKLDKIQNQASSGIGTIYSNHSTNSSHASKRSNSHGASDSHLTNSRQVYQYHHNLATKPPSSGHPSMNSGTSGSAFQTNKNNTAPDISNTSLIRRGESLSPDRNKSQYHHRSKSSMESNSQNSSHGQIPERVDAEQILLPLQIADEGVSKGKETNISRSKTSVSNEETRLRGYFLGNEKKIRNQLNYKVTSKMNLSKLPFPWPT